MPDAPSHWWLLILAVAITTAAPSTQSHGQQSDREAALKACLAVADETRRLGCLKSLTFGDLPTPAPPQNVGPSGLNSVPPQLQSTSSGRVIAGQWRLVRTPDPKAGKETVSLMHTAELSGSDPNFAGLVIRCGEREPEVLLVFVRPFPPRASPKVGIEGIRYNGTVVSPGAEILLAGAFVDTQTRWPSLPHIKIEVEQDGDKTKGIVLLEGLDLALGALNAACAARR